MIKRKLKKCISCGREDLPHFSNKMCKYCATKNIYNKKRIDNYKYSDFFEECKSYFAPICMETGVRVKQKKYNYCHIFPKRRYKSISEDFDNIIVLTLDKHTELDSYLDRFDFISLEENMPKSFNIIKKRLPLLDKRIPERDGRLLFKLNDYINEGESN